eukprot:1092124-Rhodomonas_salina.2
MSSSTLLLCYWKPSAEVHPESPNLPSEPTDFGYAARAHARPAGAYAAMGRGSRLPARHRYCSLCSYAAATP